MTPQEREEKVIKILEALADHYWHCGKSGLVDATENNPIVKSKEQLLSLFPQPLSEEEVEKVIKSFVVKHSTLNGSAYYKSDYCTSKEDEDKEQQKQNKDIRKLAQAIYTAQERKG